MSNQSPINLVSVKCPDCGAALSIEEGRKQAFCTYCGAKLLIENKNEYIIRKVDEAEIARHEKEREVRLKELETEQAEGKNEAKVLIIVFGFFIMLILMCLLIMKFH